MLSTLCIAILGMCNTWVSSRHFLYKSSVGDYYLLMSTSETLGLTEGISYEPSKDQGVVLVQLVEIYLG